MNEDCPFCRYEKSEENCRGCFEGSNYRPKPTNADRIRSMTDKELAKYLYVKTCEDGYPQFDNIPEWLNWLKQECTDESN